jgi:hypothetical protein
MISGDSHSGRGTGVRIDGAWRANRERATRTNTAVLAPWKRFAGNMGSSLKRLSVGYCGLVKGEILRAGTSERNTIASERCSCCAVDRNGRRVWLSSKRGSRSISTGGFRLKVIWTFARSKAQRPDPAMRALICSSMYSERLCRNLFFCWRLIPTWKFLTTLATVLKLRTETRTCGDYLT